MSNTIHNFKNWENRIFEQKEESKFEKGRTLIENYKVGKSTVRFTLTTLVNKETKEQFASNLNINIDGNSFNVDKSQDGMFNFPKNSNDFIDNASKLKPTKETGSLTKAFKEFKEKANSMGASVNFNTEFESWMNGDSLAGRSISNTYSERSGDPIKVEVDGCMFNFFKYDTINADSKEKKGSFLSRQISVSCKGKKSSYLSGSTVFGKSFNVLDKENVANKLIPKTTEDMNKVQNVIGKVEPNFWKELGTKLKAKLA